MTSTWFSASQKIRQRNYIQTESLGPCPFSQAVQPEPSGVQPPVPTPVRADAAIPQVEQQSGDDTCGDSPMTGGAPVPQVDAKVPEAPLQTSNAASQPECKGAPAEGETADAAKEVSRKAIV
jgi:hypothetical protein